MRDDEFERLYAAEAAGLFSVLAYRTGDRALAEDRGCELRGVGNRWRREAGRAVLGERRRRGDGGEGERRQPDDPPRRSRHGSRTDHTL